jgi:hypothetical protein
MTQECRKGGREERRTRKSERKKERKEMKIKEKETNGFDIHFYISPNSL